MVEVAFNGPCCFCGKMIEDSDVDPCSVKVETAGGKWQVWCCHALCFKALIAETPHIDMSPAHF